MELYQLYFTNWLCNHLRSNISSQYYQHIFHNPELTGNILSLLLYPIIEIFLFACISVMSSIFYGDLDSFTKLLNR